MRKATTKGMLPYLCGTICSKILEGCQGILPHFLVGLFSSRSSWGVPKSRLPAFSFAVETFTPAW